MAGGGVVGWRLFACYIPLCMDLSRSCHPTSSLSLLQGVAISAGIAVAHRGCVGPAASEMLCLDPSVVAVASQSRPH